MLDLKVIREHPDIVSEACANKGMSVDIDRLLKIDTEHRKLLKKIQDLKEKKNKASDQIGLLIKEKKDAKSYIAETKTLSQEIAEIEPKVDEVSKKMAKILLTIPNIPHSSAPIGPDASANTIHHEWGKKRTFSFQVQDHITLMEKLHMIHSKAAGKLSGSGFALLTGAGARLERALINFMLDVHTGEHGYVEVAPPYLVNEECMIGTGQLPKLEEDMYFLEGDGLYLIPTAEVPVTNIYRESILEEDNLPIRHCAYSGCFRREAGSYGKDTKGLQRLHQFDKVELVKIVRPEHSYEELEKLLLDAEKIVQILDLPYRVQELATGDMSFAAAKCYDIELYAPGMDSWLEVSSCSNFEDFQSRRAGIKFRRKKDKQLEFAHTLNGSGVALPRLMIAIVENYQNKDGTISLPQALRPYMNGADKISG